MPVVDRHTCPHRAQPPCAHRHHRAHYDDSVTVVLIAAIAAVPLLLWAVARSGARPTPVMPPVDDEHGRPAA